MSSLMSQELAGRTMAYRRELSKEPARAAVRKTPARAIIFFVALFAVSLFYVWSHAQVVKATYTLSRLQHHEAQLSTQNEKLRLEIATLRAPASLARAATDQLKMAPPDPGQVVMVK